MSAIVAVEGPGGVGLAWDTRVVAEDAVDHGLDKAGLVAPGVALGVAGDIAPGQALRFGWEPDLSALGDDLVRWLHREVLDWRELLEPWGREAGTWPVHALVCVRGQALVVWSDLSVTRSPRGYSAVGSGQAWAEGFLCGLRSVGWDLGYDAERLAAMAVDCAAEHVVNVGGAVRSIWVPA